MFLRTDVSSASRARAFLWLCFNYLESPSSDDDYDEESSPNPFSDSNSKFSAPPFTFLTSTELETENRETAEDLAVTEKLMTQRSRIVQHHGAKETAGKASAKASVNGSVLGDDEEMAAPAPEEPKARGKRTAPAKAKRAATIKETKPTAPKEKPPTKHLAEVDDDDDDEEDDNLIDAFVKREWPS